MNIIELAKQARLRRHQEQAPSIDGVVGNWEELEAFAKLVAAHEREECAQICDGFYLSWIDIQGRYEFMGEGASGCAGAIRKRSNT
jgi:hypothetical protein